MELTTQNYLRALDNNHNGTVSYRELKALDSNGDGQLNQAETKHQIPLSDLNGINQKLQMFNQALSFLPFYDETAEAYSQAELNSELFPGGVAGINPNDVQQGGLGDCYFLAALASLAKYRPREIINMITDHGNGKYTVKFPGVKQAIIVSKPADGWRSGTGYDTQNRSNGSSWVQVLEKAFVEYVMKTNRGTVKTTVDDVADGVLGAVMPGAWLAKKAIGAVTPTASKNPHDYFKWGGFQWTAFDVLSNRGTDTDVIALTSNSTTRSKLKTHLAKGSMVTASTAGSGSSKHNLAADHVYSVLAYDEKSDTLTIRNPHGTYSDAIGLTYQDNQNDGIFKMTLSEFNRYFNFIAYEQN